ncbi:MAG TPA: SDR family oxidoreductase, partial [Flavisolibacter sp.]|nr:SDR family oxidoreductase [Flavisolibacter sp.]
WFHQMWETVNKVKEEGVDLRAITAWAIFGLTGWNKLCTQPGGVYEPGVFNVSSGAPRPTALAHFLQELTRNKAYYHPIIENKGWWQRGNRKLYGDSKVINLKKEKTPKTCRPLIILGKTGTLGTAFRHVCEARNIHHLVLSRADMDITNGEHIAQVIERLNPWGIVNAAGYINVDKAETEPDACMAVNCEGPARLASECKERGIRFLSFSTDLVFDGNRNEPYVESDGVNPLNVYGRSKAASEEAILRNNADALVIRTSSFFGPWDAHNFITTTLAKLRDDKPVKAAGQVFVTPTYVPDLVHTCLDLLMDGDSGVFHITNGDTVSWAQLATKAAVMAGYDTSLIRDVSERFLYWKAKRPRYCALASEKGITLPTLDEALASYFEAQETPYRSGRVAI